MTAMLYIVQKLILKFSYFRRAMFVHNFWNRREVAVGSLPAHNFVRSPCCYFWL